MNLLTDEIETLAESVKFKIMANKARFAVYVDEAGRLTLERPNEPRRRKCLPDTDLVGLYTAAARCADIEDDLRVRLGEIGH